MPVITLVALIGLIIALLYIGYAYISDDTRGSEELTSVAIDTATTQPLAQEEPEMLMAPQESDTSSQPAPVDLSQATPQRDAAEANPEAEAVAAANRETSEGRPTGAEKTTSAKPVLTKAVTPKETPKPEPDKATSVATDTRKTPTGGVGTTHTVAPGETFYSIANRYHMSVANLKALNPNVTETQIKAGSTKLNVKVRAIHTVGPGDVLRVVAQKYGVSKEALMKANHKTKDIATRGEKLIIPYP